jgi:hypothetical protein
MPPWSETRGRGGGFVAIADLWFRASTGSAVLFEEVASGTVPGRLRSRLVWMTVNWGDAERDVSHDAIARMRFRRPRGSQCVECCWSSTTVSIR